MKFYRRISLLFLILIQSLSYAQDIFYVLPAVSNENFKSLEMNYRAHGKIVSADKISIGMKGGINFSWVIPLSRNSIFSGDNAEIYQKDYNPPYENTGFQTGFILQYNLNRILKLSLQPLFTDYTYKYATNYSWQGNTNLNYISEYAHRIRFIEIPLILGSYMTYKPWQPYFQGGIYYGRLLDAKSFISVQESSSNLAGSEQSLNYQTMASSGDLYRKNHYGILGGAGIAYLAGNTRIGIEANYRILLSNLNTVETQYTNNQVVSGNYDVPDKFKFSNLDITLNVIIPLFCKNTGAKGGAVFCE